MSNISRVFVWFVLIWREGGVSDMVAEMKLYDMLCKNIHVSQQEAGGVWDIDLENNDFPIIATGLVFPVLILPKQNRAGNHHDRNKASSLYQCMYQSNFDTIKCISRAPVLCCLSQLHADSEVAGKKRVAGANLKTEQQLIVMSIKKKSTWINTWYTRK